MAYQDYIQGEPIPLSFDLTDAVAVLDFNQVMVEIYKNNYDAKLKYRYPTTTGYITITKVGDVYSFSITSAQTKLLLSQYNVEITLLKDGTEISKGQAELFNIKKEAK